MKTVGGASRTRGAGGGLKSFSSSSSSSPSSSAMRKISSPSALVWLLRIAFFGCWVFVIYVAFPRPAVWLEDDLHHPVARNNDVAGDDNQSKNQASQPPTDDWKLWHDMTPSEQTDAFRRLKPYVKKYGDLYNKGRIVKHGTCNNTEFRSGHSLCLPAPPQPCNFFSFGINDDPSFDQALADAWGCRGFAADPTVHHPSKLHPLVTFHNIGLKTLEANEERLINKGGETDWWMMSIPGIFRALGLKHLDVLKIDCEGCEVAFSRDILLEDRYFLHKVDQISLETHTSRSWINSTEAAYYFGLIFPLMEEAGFVLEWSDRCGCSKRHEITGCTPEILDMGFPCGYKPWPGKTNVVLGRSCQDALYKRYPSMAQVKVG